jgi:hypothetical protein
MKLGDKNMRSDDLHLSDSHLSNEQLLLAADGELPARQAAEAQAHLAACWDCRARMAEIEGTITGFARAHRQTLDPQLPPIAGPRARLRAELAGLASIAEISPWRTLLQFASSRLTAWQFSSAARAAAFAGLALLTALGVGRVLSRHSSPHAANSTSVAFERGAVPDRSLTPGATRRVTIGDVCSMPHEEVVGEVSTALRQQVFREYGIVDGRSNDYEIDYLIAPGLGGTEDIHNLWPEPYLSPTWNAHVKDALEEHLHEMVCAGTVDLSTAQRDIATNWIAAYKKYFHTDRPLALSSGLI